MRIELDKAIKIVRDCFKLERTIKKPILECENYILKDDFISTMNQPPFRRSAMDGYAVKREDVAIDKSIRVTCEIDAGDTNVYKYENGNAYRIMTGAAVPDGCDLVVPQELTDYGTNNVIIYKIPDRSNICHVGEDYVIGQCLICKNEILNANHISILASNGIKTIEVYDKTKISIIITGDEIAEHGNALKYGQIYDSISPYLVTRLKQMNCHVVKVSVVKDDSKLLIEELNRACLESDFIITVGGVSVGNKDLLELCMKQIGADIKFHGINIKPGMPTMFSVYKNIPILSLSGNPFAASSLFEFLFPLNKNIDTYAYFLGEYNKKRMSDRIVRGKIDCGRLEIFANQTNGSVGSGAKTNCLAILPKGDNSILNNTEVKIKIIV